MSVLVNQGEEKYSTGFQLSISGSPHALNVGLNTVSEHHSHCWKLGLYPLPSLIWVLHDTVIIVQHTIHSVEYSLQERQDNLKGFMSEASELTVSIILLSSGFAQIDSAISMHLTSRAAVETGSKYIFTPWVNFTSDLQVSSNDHGVYRDVMIAMRHCVQNDVRISSWVTA